MGNSTSAPLNIKYLEQATLFNKHELIKWHKSFQKELKDLNRAKFISLYRSFFPFGDSIQYAEIIFNVLDTNKNGIVEFDEFITYLSILSRGTATQKADIAFNVYDYDNDGIVSRADLTRVVESVQALAGNLIATDNVEKRVDYLIERVFQSENITRQEFTEGVARDPEILDALGLYDTLI